MASNHYEGSFEREKRLVGNRRFSKYGYVLKKAVAIFRRNQMISLISIDTGSEYKLFANRD